ncbi:MAG: hypothetical protein AAF511_07530, partial [Pseudomonadota bacterium]
MLQFALLFVFAGYLFGHVPSTAANHPVSSFKPYGSLYPAGRHVVFFDRFNLFVLEPRKGTKPSWVRISQPLGTAH